MGVYGGRFAAVNGIPAVRNWQINDDHSPALFVNSATAIGHGRRQGVSQWAGGMGCHGAIPEIMPGNFFSFVGYTAPTNNVFNGAGQKYSGNAIVDAVSIVWDWQGGQVLSHQIQFSGDGALTAGSGTAVVDNTVSDPEIVGITKIAYLPAAGGSETVLTNLTQATLNISSANVPYVNSSTGGNTGRKPGIIDWNASINVEDSVLYSGLVKGTSYIWKFYVTDTLFYSLKWGMVVSASNLNVQPESGAILSYTLNIAMNGTYNLSGTPTIGGIILPDTTAYWGS